MRVRPRRLRASGIARSAVAETSVSPRHLVVPRFVIPGERRREPVAAMPGVERLTADLLVEEVRRDVALGLRATLLFGVPAKKSPSGASAADPEGPVPRALRLLRKAFPPEELLTIADVCLCPYSESGHCGVPDTRGRIQNDVSLPLLAEAAGAYAEAGADWVAPSDMMDGRVGAIRDALDDAGLPETGILAYSAKFASAYYGPFRDAAKSAPAFGDRRSYQMDPRNAVEAVKEALLDEAEGADVVMVKPALPYLDVVRAIRDAVRVPVAAYNVSGEYAMVKLAAERGLVDEGAVVRENLLAIRRAGADLIVTYHARDAVEQGWLAD